MNVIVVDASVVAAAFLIEPYHETARGILTSGRTLCAPDSLAAEVGNVIWRRSTRRELSDKEAECLLADILRLPIHYTPSAALAGVALPMAIRTGRTVYDCLYVALAVEQGSVMVTGDQRLVSALAGTPLAAYVEWIGQTSGTS
ncbi:MAG: type II toxin-antitoxin system VapC family toxin [Planctomycetes bacterium]|nr:type II toxin-antitoxin system VapC family toxin [Planctomycetota bacterium]